MKDTKPDVTPQNMKIRTKDGVLIEVEAPYCTPKEWANRTKMTEREVREALYDGHISRFQHSPRGKLFVNVLAETQKVLDTPAWK
ncbi:hypothetical protein OA92_10070 [Marinomonas sp. SBI22]|uniref:hypothetical protein n=1 Tax=unclassified Marinomonas TaxID=196814 RepID=UPI0007AFC422|nr:MULTISPECIES: hypothetical protein [unclassified Marinomonas]KZM43096.1 hypothetical protein OA92_10070 [Marinomonas sp. SBI22]KZM44667.1 hypothetical protein OA91_09495 [Marinomonas sp. SBI8L]